MAADEEEKPRGFKVEDRRRFSDSGEPRQTQREADEPPPASDARAASPLSEPAQAPPIGAEAEPLEINFATFVLSLSTQALAHLGEIPDPVDRSSRVDLHAARQIIDIIGMLRDKTRGNLDEAENALLENALYDLRMRYVDLAQRR
jgi:hypothetical protein